VPHHCRRIGHAGLAGAIFEYGRNLGTGDWSTLSHLSDMDLTVVEKLATVPLATTLAAIGGVRACALNSSRDPLDGRAHPLELGAQSGVSCFEVRQSNRDFRRTIAASRGRLACRPCRNRRPTGAFARMRPGADRRACVARAHGPRCPYLSGIAAGSYCCREDDFDQ
jgi:hypothetical protein